ncbi:MAG: AAA family ATPase, partial [Bacteroidota bacterium]
LKENESINGYFASDLMVSKTHEIVKQLKELQENGKAESLETNLKTIKEETIRKLKDKLDLFEDGENVIRLGKHKFGVNKQILDLNIVVKDDVLYYQLSGTDFSEKIDDDSLAGTEHIWNQELISENDTVYRSEYLAYKIYKEQGFQNLLKLTEEQLAKLVQEKSNENYSEGYVKGVHNQDALLILSTLIKTEENLGLLKYESSIRSAAQFFWKSLDTDLQKDLNHKIKAAGDVLHVFPNGDNYRKTIDAIEIKVNTFLIVWSLTDIDARTVAKYLFDELCHNNTFVISANAMNTKRDFLAYLKDKNHSGQFEKSVLSLTQLKDKVDLASQWATSFLQSEGQDLFYLDEIVVLLLSQKEIAKKINHIPSIVELTSLKGSHPVVGNDSYVFNYHTFLSRLKNYDSVVLKDFTRFRKLKKELLNLKREELKLEEFKPKVLSSFVRNKLIDQIYLPLFGENLSKQLGTVGETKRTDRMGMLLLISPPGYGKTTLMEYISERLGLVFMKINGPAIGHQVTAVDPASATNAASRQELEKLNLAFEMGNNVMLYLDDIQHCNTEFLQKFISLADGQRKIEGIYNGKSKTYDFRNKKFCVIMAGNPYTESGDKFQIPDMLTNRADVYNLGDVIGSSAELFELSLIENALTSNDTLRELSSKSLEDVYKIISHVQMKGQGTLELTANHTKQEIQDYISVISKVIHLRNTVLKTNAQYIESAAMDDAYRTEPPFKLQGSYRDMNKLTAKVVPIMNDTELQDIVMSHYESEAQTLTSSAEANLLKFKELNQLFTEEESIRWESIKTTFVQNNKLKGLGSQNEMAQVLMQLIQFSDNLEGIKNVLAKGFEGGKSE